MQTFLEKFSKKKLENFWEKNLTLAKPVSIRSPKTHTLIIIELVKLPKLCLTEYNWPSLFKHIYFIVIGFDVNPVDRWRCGH